MDWHLQLNSESGVPLYRQLYDQISELVRSGDLAPGDRLPATRELAGLLGLNRATISTAYELLEAEGLITGQVGRGSFVAGPAENREQGVDWEALLAPAGSPAGVAGAGISFVMSRPSRDLFPLDAFRSSCRAVLDRQDLADILQLGSPSGYEPLRRLLLEDARRSGLARPGDDVIVTNGCQQALDLIGRVLLRSGDRVAVEDPVYPGLKNLLTGMGARLLAIPVGSEGMDMEAAERVLREKPRFLVVTSNFQNPTGATLPLEARRALLDAARQAGVPVVENDAYGDLRYCGAAVAPLKQLDDRGGTILLRSFSKVSFPGLRVGWVLGPQPLIERLRHAKEAADLHTDQLSQAVLLEFMESGRLEEHRQRVLVAGRRRLEATLEGCRQYLPSGARYTRPEGGMNVWVRLPEPLDTAALLPRARMEGVAYVPGLYFTVARPEPGALRLSFASLTPDEIRRGLEILGRVVAAEMKRADFQPESALV